MGSKLSSSSDATFTVDRPVVDGGMAGLSGSVSDLSARQHRRHQHRHAHQTPTSGSRSRTRSLGGLNHRQPHASAAGASPDEDESPEFERPRSRSLIGAALPIRVFSFGIKCPVCSKLVQSEDVECHLVMCLTKPRVVYNDDVLTEDKGECVICLDDLRHGDTIARLPCLCIYHKSCIDRWFTVNRSCPEHPGD
jgi:E3 ubiquitin-protein ligase ZNRF1/2